MQAVIKLSDGLYRHRNPPDGSWYETFDPEKFPGAVYHAKGLLPVFKPKGEIVSMTPVPDVFDIGAIEYLRQKRRFLEAVTLSSTQTEFQGKRIMQLLYLENGFDENELKIIEKNCNITNSRVDRIGRWKLYSLIKTLYELNEIAKDEFNVLNELRKLRNDLEHNPYSKFKLDTKKADELLKDVIQVLLRMRELPISLTMEIKGTEYRQFWDDLGYDEYL